MQIERFYRNWVFPIVGFYFSGVFVGIGATFAFYLGQDFRLAIYPIAMFIGVLSGIIILFSLKKEKGGGVKNGT